MRSLSKQTFYATVIFCTFYLSFGAQKNNVLAQMITQEAENSVPQEQKQNDSLTLEGLREQAAQNDSNAQYALALVLVLGELTTRNIDAATQLLLSAANQSDPRALNLLGLLLDPIWGFEKANAPLTQASKNTEDNLPTKTTQERISTSSERAAEYYARAAALGFEAANHNLNALVAKGHISSERASALRADASNATRIAALGSTPRAHASSGSSQTKSEASGHVPTPLTSKDIFRKIAPAIAELKTEKNYGSAVILGNLRLDPTTQTITLSAQNTSYPVQLHFESFPVPMVQNQIAGDYLFLATNAHVVQKAKALLAGIGLRGEAESTATVPAHYVCESQVPQEDLAFVLVQISTLPKEILETLSFAKLFSESEAPQKGSIVYAIGNPEGLTRSIAQGLYNGIRPEGIQFDAPISVGSSGGALVSDQGELLGITTGFVSNKDSQNLNFALPSFQLVQNLRMGQSLCRKLAF